MTTTTTTEVARTPRQLGIALSLAAASACAASKPLGRATATAPGASADRTVEIAVTRAGFEPSVVAAHAGETIDLVFTRTVAHTCVTRVILWLTKDQTVERDLPLHVPVHLTLTLDAPGDIGFSCPMYMRGGRIDVKASP